MGGSRAVQPSRAARAAAAVDDEAALDLLDVPAAVLCAACGSAECAGCAVDDEAQASSIIAVVPWERPNGGLLKRLFSTARLATTSSESFFGSLSDGETAVALRFAVLAELLAVSGLLVTLTPLVLAAAPWLPGALRFDPALRQAFGQALACGVPGVALAMVAIHAAHGLGLDWGARRQGSPHGRRARGLRFGLYACGWDLLTLPLGLCAIALLDGPRQALQVALLGVRVPARASRAYLMRVHQLDERGARVAARFSLLIAGAVMTGLGALVLLLCQLA